MLDSTLSELVHGHDPRPRAYNGKTLDCIAEARTAFGNAIVLMPPRYKRTQALGMDVANSCSRGVATEDSVRAENAEFSMLVR